MCLHRWGKVSKRDGYQHCVHCREPYVQQIDDNEVCNHPKWEIYCNVKSSDSSAIVGRLMQCVRCGYMEYIGHVNR
jgi:hypothetical protein